MDVADGGQIGQVTGLCHPKLIKHGPEAIRPCSHPSEAEVDDDVRRQSTGALVSSITLNRSTLNGIETTFAYPQ